MVKGVNRRDTSQIPLAFVAVYPRPAGQLRGPSDRPTERLPRREAVSTNDCGLRSRRRHLVAMTTIYTWTRQLGVLRRRRPAGRRLIPGLIRLGSSRCRSRGADETD